MACTGTLPALEAQQREIVMNRRALLVQGCWAAASFLLCCLASPGKAFALGGVLPQLGQRAPDFDLAGISPDATGQPLDTTVSLETLKGRWVVLYFYPKDFTSGCTLEARGFQRDLEAFAAANAVVIGVSADDPDQHAEFCGSEGLRYTLLSDPGGVVSQRYGSWIAPFSQRHTFLIDPNGVLQASWTAVRPAGHSQEVLGQLMSLQSRTA